MSVFIIIIEVAILAIWVLKVQQTATSDYSLLGPLWTLSLILTKVPYGENESLSTQAKVKLLSTGIGSQCQAR